jgi:N-acetylmuramic acid 6-phosphate (MurNAc-6-P) etherase
MLKYINHVTVHNNTQRKQLKESTIMPRSITWGSTRKKNSAQLKLTLLNVLMTMSAISLAHTLPNQHAFLFTRNQKHARSVFEPSPTLSNVKCKLSRKDV